MLTIQLIDQSESLNELIGQWDRLYCPSPMQSPLWMLNAWHAYRKQGESLNVIAMRAGDGRLVGLVPWYRQEGFATGTTLRFLGDGPICSDFQSILHCPEHATEVQQTLVEWLVSGQQKWDQLELEGCCQSDAWMTAFHQEMASRGHVTHWKPTLNTWRIDLEQGWDTIQANFSRTQRAQIRNFLNRFEKGNFQLQLASNQPGNFQFFIEELIRLHQLRWQSVGQPGCFAAPNFKQFFQHAMHDMLIDGSAEIALLEREGRAVAANAWLMRNKIAFGYQCGRDPAEDAHKVGRILLCVCLRHHIGEGMIAVDYLRGDEQYKSTMRAQPTPCGRLRIVAKARLPELRHSLWETCRDMKSLFTSEQRT